jgi:hypothetical protein
MTASEVAGAARRTSARSVARLTEALSTPGTAAMAFSTRRTQEAQVIPSTGKLWSGGGVIWFMVVLSLPFLHHRQA